MLGEIAKATARLHHEDLATQIASTIQVSKNRILPSIAESILELGNIERIKMLLEPCAYYIDAAYKMCYLLAKAYPNQACSIAEIVAQQA